MDIRTNEQQYNPYRIFTREQWARLRDDTPMTLEPGDVVSTGTPAGVGYFRQYSIGESVWSPVLAVAVAGPLLHALR